MVECAPRVCSTGCAGRVSGVCRDVMPRCWVTHSVVAAHIVLDNTRKNANCHGPTYRPWQTSRALVARRALLDVRDQATASTITTQTTCRGAWQYAPHLASPSSVRLRNVPAPYLQCNTVGGSSNCAGGGHTSPQPWGQSMPANPTLTVGPESPRRAAQFEASSKRSRLPVPLRLVAPFGT